MKPKSTTSPTLGAPDPAKRIFLEPALPAVDRRCSETRRCSVHLRDLEQPPVAVHDAVESASEDLRRIGRLRGECVGLSGAGGAYL